MMWGEYSEYVSNNSLRRLNISSPLDKRYFKDKYQAFPANGYDEMFQKMIDNKNITVLLNGNMNDEDTKWIHKVYSDTPIIYTGRIDKILGRNDLPFMTMGFETVLNGAFPWSDKYGVINFPQDFDFIRAHSSKILYRQDTKNDVVVYEYPRRTGPECYPIRYGDLIGSIAIYKDIVKKVENKYPNIIPAGRAGKFEYMNMDMAVLDGLNCASLTLSERS
jgi:UDP-galactopyranose mutase